MARSDKHVDVALSESEYELISEIAKNKNISRGNVFKALMFEEYKNKYSLLSELKQANQTSESTSKRIGELQSELARYEGQIVKIGINVNQIARAINTLALQGSMRQSDVKAILSALDSINDSLQVIDDKVGNLAVTYMAGGVYGYSED